MIVYCSFCGSTHSADQRLAALPLAVVMGIGMAGIGMCVMHDAIHGLYSEKDWLNRLVGASIYLLGSNKLNWKIQHNVLHHTPLPLLVFFTNKHDTRTIPSRLLVSRPPIPLTTPTRAKSY